MTGRPLRDREIVLVARMVSRSGEAQIVVNLMLCRWLFKVVVRDWFRLDNGGLRDLVAARSFDRVRLLRWMRRTLYTLARSAISEALSMTS